MKKIRSFKNISISKAPPILLSVITVGAIMDTSKDIKEGKTSYNDNFVGVVISIILVGLTIFFWLKKNGNFD